MNAENIENKNNQRLRDRNERGKMLLTSVLTISTIKTALKTNAKKLDEEKNMAPQNTNRLPRC